MALRVLALVIAIGYFAFSVFYILRGGFEDPPRAIWVGLIGMLVMAFAMALYRRGGKK